MFVGAVFASLASVHLYTSLNTILLGMLQGPLAVAQYSLGEKIYSAIRGLFAPAIQALFPWLAARHKADITAYRKTVRLLAAGFIASLSVLAAALVALSGPITVIISGTHDPVIENVLLVFSFCLLLAMGVLLSPLLVIQGQSRYLLYITILTTVANLICVLPLIHFHGAVGAAEAFAGAQLVHAAGLIYTNREVLFVESQQANRPP